MSEIAGWGEVFDAIEIRPRPKKDGLHDSGYRFIEVTGLRLRAGEPERVVISSWSDNVRFGVDESLWHITKKYGGVVPIHGTFGFDVTGDGKQRVFAHGGRRILVTSCGLSDTEIAIVPGNTPDKPKGGVA